MGATDTAGGVGEAVVRLRSDVAAFLYSEARLLDDGKFEQWHALFHKDGIYWIPLQPDKAPEDAPCIVYDTPLRREERVHHLLHVPFAAQQPPSRTVHVVSNVEVTDPGPDLVRAASVQVIYELRLGDFRQTGLGEPRAFAARVGHTLERVDGRFLIHEKKIVLLERDLALSNMTTIY